MKDTALLNLASAVEFATADSAEVGSSATEILSLPLVGGPTELVIEITNTGSAALTAFDIYLLDHKDGTAYLYSARLNFDVAPGTLAAGTTAHVRCLIPSAWKAIVKATCATATTVTARGVALGNTSGMEARWSVPAASTTMLSTGLDSLASSATAGKLSTAILRNDLLGHRFAAIELVLAYASAPTAGTPFSVYLLKSLDGTTYDSGTDSVLPHPHNLVGTLALQNSTTTNKAVFENIPIGPWRYKLLALNTGAQALASSGSTIKVVTYNEARV